MNGPVILAGACTALIAVGTMLGGGSAFGSALHLPPAASAGDIERKGRLLLGAPLATAISYSRLEALRAGVRPIPPDIRAKLAPYFEPELLEQVRWTTADRPLSLDGVLTSWLDRESAVTLGDVVVFSEEGAARDPGLWAHELTHVEQYARRGLDGFAASYITSWRSLEREARRRSVATVKSIRLSARPPRWPSRSMLPRGAHAGDGGPQAGGRPRPETRSIARLSIGTGD